MIDFGARKHLGPDRGPWFPGTVAAMLAIVPVSAQAGAWADFETRCLSALENQVPPVVAGLGQGAREGTVTRYALAGGRTLMVESAPDDGRRSCAVRDSAPGAGEAFDAWIARAIDEERYVAVAAGRWMSHLWIEPVLEVQKTQADGVLTLRIVETDLEA